MSNKITQDRKESDQIPCTYVRTSQCEIAHPEATMPKLLTLNLVAIHLSEPFALKWLSFHSIHLRTTTSSPFFLSLFSRSIPYFIYDDDNDE